MAIQSDETLVTKGDLKELYQDKILPYLGGNMMMSTNISDYYSEDEKIVGVWTNGKPLYQKTITLSLPEITTDGASATETIPFSDSRINIVNPEIGWVKYGYVISSDTGKSIANVNTAWGNEYETAQYFIYAAFHISLNGIMLQTNRLSVSQSPTILTVCYTKTTDTANSAAATPGCYDITRPDLWPENKEIFFGNGLYGYRAVGTVNITANTLTEIKLNVMLRNIISSGGYGTYNSTGDYMALNYNQSDGRYALSLYGHVIDGLYISYKVAITHNAHYDIWVTYTK